MNGGIRYGRETTIDEVRAAADVGFTNVIEDVVAIRGARLALTRARYTSKDQRPEAFYAEVLHIFETDADNRVTATVVFDPDEIDDAFEELDTRYAAGEAAAHAHTWALVARAYVAFNRHELSAMTSDFASIDHRRGIASAPGDLFGLTRAAWDVAPDLSIYIAAIHRLNTLGAVVTAPAHGKSTQGFHAGWRDIHLLTFEGDLINRCEIFDESDLDAALARFDELGAPAPLLENAATRTRARQVDAINRRDLDGFVGLTTADGRYEDRRKGFRDEGPLREAARAVIETLPLAWRARTEPVAVRGAHLALTRDTYRDISDVEQPITVERLVLIEVADDGLMRRGVLFDPDDLDGAFEELDARYLAGDAADHARTWSAISGAIAAANRHEAFSTTPDWVNINHHRATSFEPGELNAYIRSSWDDMPDGRTYIEAVHRLSNLGAVIAHRAEGTTRGGFEAEWRGIDIIMVDGNLIKRSEMFEEADLDVALATFDELTPSAAQLENAATRVYASMMDAHNRRDLDSFVAVVAADGRYEDRRKGLRDEGLIKPDFARALFVAAASSWQEERELIAIRGPRLVLCRLIFRDHGEVDRPIAVEALVLTEVTEDELTSRLVIFDPDDINGAFGELTARWIATRAVAHPEVIEASHNLNEAYNRHDWDAVAAIEGGATYVNHRQLASGVMETIADHWRSMWALESLIPDLWVEGPEILAQSATGVVNSVVVKGTTAEGAAIELPAIILLLFDGPRVIRMEAFDLDQRDLALARFKELNQRD